MTIIAWDEKAGFDSGRYVVQQEVEFGSQKISTKCWTDDCWIDLAVGKAYYDNVRNKIQLMEDSTVPPRGAYSWFPYKMWDKDMVEQHYYDGIQIYGEVRKIKERYHEQISKHFNR